MISFLIPPYTNPQQGLIVPPAARRRTGERRTDQQRKRQGTLRPREAVAKEMDSERGLDWRDGGSPEGVAVIGGKSDTPSGPREVGLARRALSMLALMARSPRLALRLAWAGMLLSRERERRDSRKVKQHKASPPARLRFHTRTIMQLQSFPLRLRKLFLESGGFSKDASLIVPAGTEQGFHPCTPPGPPRPWTPPGALAPGPFLAFTPCQILQPML